MTEIRAAEAGDAGWMVALSEVYRLRLEGYEPLF